MPKESLLKGDAKLCITYSSPSFDNRLKSRVTQATPLPNQTSNLASLPYRMLCFANAIAVLSESSDRTSGATPVASHPVLVMGSVI
jgi:hypothetical protein